MKTDCFNSTHSVAWSIGLQFWNAVWSSL